jgi:GT2 family glycosyltransferase
VVPYEEAILPASETIVDRQAGSVAAVIPNWNRADLLARVLGDLGRQTYPLEKVIVVDNGSTDSSAEVARSLGAEVFQLPRNEGFAAAVNRGIGLCNSDWVLILNNDVTFGPDWVKTLLLGAIRANAHFAVGKLKSARTPDYLDGTYDAISRGATSWRCGHGCLDGPEWSVSTTVRFPSLTAGLFRRSVFDDVGLLDERFESYLEDADFGLRCAALGRTGVYVPEAVAEHEGSATLGAWHKATVRRISRNQIFLVKKHFRGAPAWPIVAAQLLWGSLAICRGSGADWLRGKFEGVRTKVDPIPGQWARIRNVVRESEDEIRALQRRGGGDLYWKLYFAFVRS